MLDSATVVLDHPYDGAAAWQGWHDARGSTLRSRNSSYALAKVSLDWRGFRDAWEHREETNAPTVRGNVVGLADLDL